MTRLPTHGNFVPGMNAPSITIGIPTHNRAALWRRALLWRSLVEQSRHDELEVIICDDNSTDDTLHVIADMLRSSPPPFAVRLLRTTAPKELPTQASGLPDNVIFKEARGEWFVHLDDDGWVHRDLVKFLRCNVPPAIPVIWYGKIIFVDPATLEPLAASGDARMARHRIPPDAIAPMQPQWEAEWGSLWVTRMDIIRRIGGHEMGNIAWRGCDSRFGARIRQVAKPWFVSHSELTFWHLDVPWQQQQVAAGRTRDLMELQRLPQHGTFDPSQVVANSGEAFWKSGALDGLYEEIPL